MHVPCDVAGIRGHRRFESGSFRVVAMAADGLSVRDIAEELGISKSKVARLQAKAREQAAAPAATGRRG